MGVAAAKLNVEFDSRGVGKVKGDIADVGNALDKTNGKGRGFLSNMFSTAGGFLMAGGLTSIKDSVLGIGSSMLSSNSNMENWTMQLEIATGSVEGANKVMADMKAMAKSSPFELPELIQGAQNLEALGMSSAKWMPIIGDTSAATGKSIDQVTQAVMDASTGEFERLKELGIRTEVAGDKVRFSFMKNGEMMTVEAENNAQGIENALMGIWDEKYDGAMDKMADSWTGRLGTLKDNINMMLMDIGKPFFDFMKGAVGGANKYIDAFTRKIEGGQSVVHALLWSIPETLRNMGFEELATQITPAIKAIEAGWNHLAGAGKAVAKVVGNLLGAAFGFLADHMDIVIPAIKGILVLFSGMLAWGAITAVIGGIGAALALLLSPIGLVIAAAALLGIAWDKNWFGIQDVVGDAWAKMKKIFGWISDAVGWIADGFKTGGWREAWRRIQVVARQAWDYIKRFFSSIDWGAVWDRITDGLAAAWEGVKSFFGDVDWGSIASALGDAASAALAGLSVAVEMLLDVLGKIGKAFWDGINSLSDWVVDNMPAASAWVSDLINGKGADIMAGDATVKIGLKGSVIDAIKEGTFWEWLKNNAITLGIGAVMTALLIGGPPAALITAAALVSIPLVAKAIDDIKEQGFWEWLKANSLLLGVSAVMTALLIGGPPAALITAAAIVSIPLVGSIIDDIKEKGFWDWVKANYAILGVGVVLATFLIGGPVAALVAAAVVLSIPLIGKLVGKLVEWTGTAWEWVKSKTPQWLKDIIDGNFSWPEISLPSFSIDIPEPSWPDWLSNGPSWWQNTKDGRWPWDNGDGDPNEDQHGSSTFGFANTNIGNLSETGSTRRPSTADTKGMKSLDAQNRRTERSFVKLDIAASEFQKRMPVITSFGHISEQSMLAMGRSADFAGRSTAAMLISVAQGIDKTGVPAWERLGAALSRSGDLTDALESLVARKTRAIGNSFGRTAGGAAKSLLTEFKGLGEGGGTAISRMASSLGTSASRIASSLKNNIATPTGGIPLTFESMRTKVGSSMGTMAANAASAWSTIRTRLNDDTLKVSSIILNRTDSQAKTAGTNFGKIASSAATQLKATRGTFDTDTIKLNSIVSNRTATARDTGVKNITTMATGMGKAAALAPDKVSNALTDPKKGLSAKISGVSGSAGSAGYGIGLAIGDGAWNGINDKTFAVQAKARAMALAALAAAKAALGVNSPSREFLNLFAFVPAGAALGIEGGIPLVRDAIRDMVALPSKATFGSIPLPSYDHSLTPIRSTGFSAANAGTTYIDNSVYVTASSEELAMIKGDAARARQFADLRSRPNGSSRYMG